MKKVMILVSVLSLVVACNNKPADEEKAGNKEAAPKVTQQVNPQVESGSAGSLVTSKETSSAPPAQPAKPPVATKESSVAKEASKWVDQTKKLGKTAWEASKKAAGDAAKATKKTAGEAYDATKEKSSSAWEATKEAAGNIYDTTKEEAAKVYETVKEKGKSGSE